MPTKAKPPHHDHDVVPHEHVVVNGKAKECPGRFWCSTCKDWFSGVKCA